MTDRHSDTAHDCADVSALLLPYVDRELPSVEHARVALHLDRCIPCRAIVAEQDEVRTLLSDIPVPPAPEELVERTLRSLDAVDSETGWGGVTGRMRAFARGALFMVPAAAAAIGLFYITSDPADDLVTPTVSAVAPGLPRLGDTGEFKVQLAPQRSLPPNIELVSAPIPGPARATVHYRHRNSGRRLIDQQSDARFVVPTGSVQEFRGHPYHLSRDDRGRARVEFSAGVVHHLLSFVGDVVAPAAAGLSPLEPDFIELLELGEAVRDDP